MKVTIYRVDYLNLTVYCAGKREANSMMNDRDDPPESCEALDAVAECSRLHKDLEAAEAEIIKLRNLLTRLYEMGGDEGDARRSAAAEILRFDPSAAASMSISGTEASR